MHKLINFSAASAMLALTTLPAAATVNKTWVSSTGSDSGSCQLVAPCKTFQFAHDQTTAGGEIDVKDTGSYGQLVITKAISIVSGDGALAAVGVPSGGVGIMINAGASDLVLLTGLVIDGHGIGQDGVEFNSGGGLTIEHSSIRNVVNDGLYVAGPNNKVLDVEDTEILNAQDAGFNLNEQTATLSKVILLKNNIGLLSSNSIITVVQSTISNNQIGIKMVLNGLLYIGSSTVSSNAFPIYLSEGGEAASFGDNVFTSNSTSIFGGPLQTQPKK